MKSSKLIPWIIIAFLFSGFCLKAQDFTYQPLNPGFGGEVYNYTWLLNSANAQNLLTDPNSSSNRRNQNPIDEFANDLQRQILNELSKQLVGNQFGEEALTEGSYTIGGFQIDVAPTSEGLSISIFDTTNGDQTIVVVPYY